METPQNDATLAEGAIMPRHTAAELRRATKYEIGGIVARGGMGAILDAREVTIERQVAMKVMLDSSSADNLTRFIGEAKITGQLEHPNIVPVHELGVDEKSQVFYTMKLVAGITLRKVLDEMAEGNAATLESYPLGALLTIFQKVCDAVAFAHARGVIHRDLKPENIMLGEFGEVLVMDWGLAKVLGPSAQCSGRGAQSEAAAANTEHGVLSTEHFGSQTLAGSILGTPHYMAPEQARGEIETMDQRADIYALGAILYHLLALRPSVTSHNAMEIVMRVGCGDIDPLTDPPAKGRGIPESLAAVCRKAMAVDPAQRYQTVPDLQAEIQAFQNGFATSAEHAGGWKQLKLFVARNRAVSIAVAAAVVILAAITVVYTDHVTRERARAEAAALLARREASRAETQATLAEHETVRAAAEAVRAQREANRAEHALAALKAQAPTLRQLAESEAAQRHFQSALEKLDAALTLDADHLPAYWRRAWILLGLEQFPAAAAAIRTAREKEPAQARLAAILPAVEWLATSDDPDKWQRDEAKAILRHLQFVGASGEAIAFSQRMQVLSRDQLKMINAQLERAYGQNGILNLDPDGTMRVTLPKLADSVEPLRGLPLTKLTLSTTKVVDLEPLRGIPLIELHLRGTAVTDLGPLTGMPLKKLDLSNSQSKQRGWNLNPLRGMPLQWLSMEKASGVSDLSALEGLPLEYLNLHMTKVRDLSPLRGAPLRFLSVGGGAEPGVTSVKSEVYDLTPLAGAPLETLLVGGRVNDLSPVRGMPLRVALLYSPDFSPLEGMDFKDLTLGGAGSVFSTLKPLTATVLRLGQPSDLAPLARVQCQSLFIGKSPKLKDVSPLLHCEGLEEFEIRDCAASPEPLRAHPTLQRISWTPPGTPGRPMITVAEFWAAYDAEQKGKRK